MLCKKEKALLTRAFKNGAQDLVSASKCKELQLRDADTVFLRTPSTLLRLRMLKDPFLDREKRHRPFSRRRDDRRKGQDGPRIVPPRAEGSAGCTGGAAAAQAVGVNGSMDTSSRMRIATSTSGIDDQKPPSETPEPVR